MYKPPVEGNANSLLCLENRWMDENKKCSIYESFDPLRT